MIIANNQIGHRIEFTDGKRSAFADLPIAKGGDGDGFGPHDLLEAALATCVAMTARMVAAKHGLPLTEVRCVVQIDRSSPEGVVLYYELLLGGSLSDDQAEQIRLAVARCPVARTLSGRISVQPRGADGRRPAEAT